MRLPILLTFVSIACLISSCSKTAGAQHATVLMRDGSSVTGTVLASSAAEIQIAGDDKVNRTIPMAQVRSIEYDETAPSGASGPAAAGASQEPPPAPHTDHYHPEESAVTTVTHEVPAGTEISVRTEETIDSDKAVDGQIYPAEVTRVVKDESGNIVIPRGANVEIIIRSSSKGGKIRGTSDLVMDLASVTIDGRRYELSTVDLQERGKSGVGANRRTGEFTGGGAAIGAIIGAIAGGGKGAAIGAGAGAGAGATTQILTRGRIKVPVESVLTFRLDKSLRVRAEQ